MSGWDDRSGPRSDKLCPACGEPVYYNGDVDITAHGDEGRSRARGIYKCVNPECCKYEEEVEPRPRR